MRKHVGVDGDAQRLSHLCWLFFLKIIDDQDQALEVTEDNYRSPIPEHLQWRRCAADAEGITGDGLLEFINQELFPYLKEMPLKGSHPNLDLKNPHSVAEDHGDPEALLADLQAAEQKAADLRDQLKAILAEALLR